MSWLKKFRWDDIGFNLFRQQRCLFCSQIGSEPLLVINIFDKGFIEAVKKRDQGIFEILEYCIENRWQIERASDFFNNIPLFMMCSDAKGMKSYFSRTNEDEIEEQLANAHVSLDDDEFSDDDDHQKWALHYIEEHEKYEEELIIKEQKKESIKNRRKQFDSLRDMLKLTLIERDEYRCANCSAVEDLTVDHIYPLSKGGSDDMDNLQLLCRRCNSLKNDKT